MSAEARRPALPDDWDDNPEWTEEDFANARPASEVMGPEFAAKLIRRGRPAKAAGEKKEAVSIRLSPDVLAYFRATGEGWQTRMDEALRKMVKARR